MRPWSPTTSTMYLSRKSRAHLRDACPDLSAGYWLHRAWRALGRQGAADVRLFTGLSRIVQPIPRVQLRGAGCVPGTGKWPHQVSHLCGSRVTAHVIQKAYCATWSARLRRLGLRWERYRQARRRRSINPQTNSMSTAPTIAPINPAFWAGPYQPMACPR
jgi:hypothetical protein